MRQKSKAMRFSNHIEAALNVYGGAGDDIIKDDRGDSFLYGGAGDDIIGGSYGNDMLDGGIGNDTLKGGKGNDSYHFSTGFGQDLIQNNESYASSATDSIHFEDTDYQDLWFGREGNNLEISVAGTDDKVTVQNWYSNIGQQVDEFEVAGSVLLNNQVDQLVSAMAAYDVPNGVGNVIPQDTKDALQPILTQSWLAG